MQAGSQGFESRQLHNVSGQGAQASLSDVFDAQARDSAEGQIREVTNYINALESDTRVGLGGWGWLVIAIAVIIGYRLLEIANDQRSPGPVMVRTGDSESATRPATEFVRSHMAAADLQEPSPVPGGEAISSITNAGEAVGIENAAVRFVVSLLQTTAFPKRGVDVYVSTQGASGHGSKSPKPEWMKQLMAWMTATWVADERPPPAEEEEEGGQEQAG